MTSTLKTIFILFLFFSLTSCLEEPKAKKETIQSANDYEKVVDEIIGANTIMPDAIKVGDRDVMVESMRIANSLTRERFRREFTVLKVEKKIIDADKDVYQIKYDFQVKYIQRDENGNPQDPVTTLRTLVLAHDADGYYQFYGQGTEYTVFSWDFLVGLRGFCSNYEDDKSSVKITCSSIKVEAANYSAENIPVRKLSLNKAFEITDKATGAVETGKLRYVIQLAPQVQEISKVLSFCVEGLQKFGNNIYQLANCNNVESF